MEYSRFKTMKEAVALGESVYAVPKAEQAVKAKQAAYAKAMHNHVPVHFIGGPHKVIIYKAIWAGFFMALANQGYLVYKQAYDLK